MNRPRLIAVVAFVVTGLLGTSCGPLPGFVGVCGTRLCQSGAPFVVKGATAYGQYGNAANEVALAKHAGVNVLELVEFDSHYHTLSDTESAATWTRVDQFIAAAKGSGLHVILNLSEYGQSLAASGQVPTTADWGPYLSFIANRVNTVTGAKYALDPTIAMVELYGEIDAPNYSVPTRGTTAQMTAFFSRTLAQWKAAAPNILVSSGGFSYINDPNSGIDWKTIMADRNDATCDVEVNSYPDRNVSVPEVAAYCKQLGKPWFLSAWSSCYRTPGWGANDINDWPSDSAMSAHAQDMYNLTKADNALGSDFWNLANKPVVNGMCDIGSQFPQTLATVTGN